MNALSGWENFYVIAGSSAGALIGLQFVVITLIASRPVVEGQAEAGAAFATPTIIHFCSVLLLSAALAAPWPSMYGAAVCYGFIGLVGAVYEIIVFRRMRRQTLYEPEGEDWLFHAILPFFSYVVLAISACMSMMHGRESLFGVAAAALLLLFVGIHNAWDAVTYHIFTKREKSGE